MSSGNKEFAIALGAALVGAALLAWMVISLQEHRRAQKDAPECVLIASLETDTYAPYGMVAFRRKLMLNQYQCGGKTKTVVE